MPVTEPEPLVSVTAPGEDSPSPQFQVAVCVSAVPGSVNDALALIVTFTALGATGAEMIPTEGATLLTVRLNVVVLIAPSLSVAVIVTVWLWTGPSVVL